MIKLQLFILVILTYLKLISCESPHCRTTDYNGTHWSCRNFRNFPIDLYNASRVEKLWMSGSDWDLPALQKLTSKDLQLYNLPNLAELRLFNYKFYEVEQGAFKNGGKLVNLALEWTSLNKLDPNVFTDVENLQKLEIKSQPWTPLENFESSEFPKLENLTDLVLEKVGLPSLQTNLFKNLKSLQTLDLNHNKLTKLDDREVFQSLKNLKTLKLSSNQISYVDPEVFADLQNLEILDLSQNNLSQGFKNGTIFHNPNLIKLNLLECYLNYIEEDLFENLGNLKELSLGNNRLSHISRKMFSPLKNLETLYLYSNPLKTLEPNIFSLPKLEHLAIGTRTLRNYWMDDSSELNIPNLQQLKITNAGLTSISSNVFKKLSNLRSLDLQFNQFTTLDWEVLRPLKKLSTIFLKRNPWQCDCRVVYLHNFLKQRKIHFFYDSPRCETFGAKGEPIPKRFNGGYYMEWKDIKPEELNCGAFPNITKMETDNEPKLRETVNLKCDFSGDLPLQVIWMKDDVILRNFTLTDNEPLQNIKSYTFIEYNDVLNIPNFQEKDAGQYKVIVSNEAGESIKSEYIYLRKEPVLPTFETFELEEIAELIFLQQPSLKTYVLKKFPNILTMPKLKTFLGVILSPF